MMDLKQLLQSVLKLQTLEFDETKRDEAAGMEAQKKIAELRLQIPLPILNHYDRLRARGKKCAAAVRNQTCTGCHMQVTKATVLSLLRGHDIQICENCGRYLYLAQSLEPESKTARAAKKPVVKLTEPEPLPHAA
jgi:predicted  nucleic acid-binding Zn-ribbon protein